MLNCGMELQCQQCGNTITYSGRGRPPSKFCSRKCKDMHRTASQHTAMLRKRAEQQCQQCGKPIPMDSGSRVQTCSRGCGVAWQNAKRQAAKREAWLATNPTCARCGDLIPETRIRNSKFCSSKCKQLEMGKRYRRSTPHYNRQYLYGITPEQWESQLEAQDNRCAICRSSEWPGKDGKPHADHDHKLEIFVLRGILCGNCNSGLGMFGDDPARLRAAADYLERMLT